MTFNSARMIKNRSRAIPHFISGFEKKSWTGKFPYFAQSDYLSVDGSDTLFQPHSDRVVLSANPKLVKLDIMWIPSGTARCTEYGGVQAKQECGTCLTLFLIFKENTPLRGV